MEIILILIILVLIFGFGAVISFIRSAASKAKAIALQAGTTGATGASGASGATENTDSVPLTITGPAGPAPVEGFDDGSHQFGGQLDEIEVINQFGPLSGTPPPVGAPVNSFAEIGDMSGGYPQDIWLDNVALTIPPSNVGMTDIIFVDAARPQQCYQKCKTSPFCRFFSYWQETGACNMHQTLQNGETTPENLLRYAYTVPFSQHWTSGYVRKSGNPVPNTNVVP